MLIVIGALLGTVAHGAHGSVAGLFWFLTIARGITGLVRLLDSSHTLAQRFSRVSAASIPHRRLAQARQRTRTTTRRAVLSTSWSRTLFFRWASRILFVAPLLTSDSSVALWLHPYTSLSCRLRERIICPLSGAPALASASSFR